jgi:uncharacterized membrane protein HdeD (DUF308 family)
MSEQPPRRAIDERTIGWYVLFAGVITTAGAIRGPGALPDWGLALAVGIAGTLLGFWLLARPGLTLVAAVPPIGLWPMVDGVVPIARSSEIQAMTARVGPLAGGLGREISSRGLGTAAG